MQWLEIKIDTVHEKIDELCAKLENLGIEGLVIDDEEEYSKFLDNNRQYWDYVDEELDSSVVGNNDYNEDGVQVNSNGSRIGFKGSEPMTANTDVIYQLEYGIDVDGDDGQSLKNRDTYLGINNKSFGEFRAGKNQSTTDYINNVVVNEGYWDNLGSTKLDSEQKVAALNMADSGRIANSIVWKAPKFEGVPVEFAAMYANDDDYAGEKNSGWGASLMFDQGTGYTLGLAYEKDLNQSLLLLLSDLAIYLS